MVGWYKQFPPEQTHAGFNARSSTRAAIPGLPTWWWALTQKAVPTGQTHVGFNAQGSTHGAVPSLYPQWRA